MLKNKKRIDDFRNAAGAVIRAKKINIFKSQEELQKAQAERMQDPAYVAQKERVAKMKLGRIYGSGDANTVNLDRHFTYYTVMKDRPDMVLNNPEQWGRFRNSPEELKRQIENSIDKRNAYEKTSGSLMQALQNIRASEETRDTTKIERRIKHHEMMIPAINEELRVAFFFGPSVSSFDQNNPHGDRPKFRTDIETADFMAEVTIGKNKKSVQLNDYVIANISKKELIMYSPNISDAGQSRAERRGFHVVRNMEQTLHNR